MDEIEKARYVYQILNSDIMSKVPENAFELHRHYTDLIDIYQKIVNNLQERADDLMEEIVSNNMTDPVYEVVYPAKRVRKINMEKLFSTYPEVYNKLAFIDTSKLTKLIPKATLLQFAIAQNPNAAQYITANLTDLEKVLDKSEAASVIDVTDTKVPKPIVVKQGKYEKDHFKNGSDDLVKVYISTV